MATPSCSVCKKPQSEGTTMQRCSKCRERLYCGKDCQTADWRTHKRSCAPPPPPPQWYDKFRKCQDGNFHEGRLELITWPCPAEGTGWGHCAIEESDDMRAKFEDEFGGDEEKLHEYWPQAFRWTCCGTDADMDYGCDHHGTGSRLCTCDYCRGGEPLPDSIYHEKTASRHGLVLQRGPDPRRYR